MSVECFLADPWRQAHPRYDDGFFSIKPAPEFATAEVLVASLYRAAGFEGVGEREVPVAGRELDKLVKRETTPPGIVPSISRESWRAILHGILESPKQPNQSAQRFLQLSPVIPDIALYSGTARLKGNSWNPGVLLGRMVSLGARTRPEAEVVWRSLTNALAVTEVDDVWARWLHEEFGRWRASGVSWEPRVLDNGNSFPAEEWDRLHFPARQFVADLAAIVDAKPLLTRRQWVSLLEAILRIGAVAHVLWLCDVNSRIWAAVRQILEGGDPPVEAGIASSLVSAGGPILAYGNQAVPTIRHLASRYLVARLGLNLVLWRLAECGVPIPGLTSCRALSELLSAVQASRPALMESNVLDTFASLRDQEARAVTCKKGIGSNLVEFGRHVLGQRETANDALRGYDQGYFLKRRGEYRAAPWVVSTGPAAVLALAHCCLHEGTGPRSVSRLFHHLAEYGIAIERDDIASTDLGRKLRMLSLVLDSPDAEGGMLLVPPFEAAAAEVAVTA